MPKAPQKLRKHYENSDHPYVILKFEDGHEIPVARNQAKAFDAYAGESIKIIAVFEPTASERELVETRKADDFPDA